MATVSLILKEIRHRKLNFVLSALAVMVAVALFVGFATTGEAYRRETRRIMLDMGQNLRIIPKEAPIDEFWSKGFSEATMPEEYLNRFTRYTGFSYTHLTATLQKRVTWQGMHVILAGILPEVLPPDRLQQKPMTFTVDPGTVYVGYEVADRFGLRQGDTLDLLGRPFTVAKCLSTSGSEDDIRIYGHLHDVQDVLDLPGRINEIKALECLCLIEASGAQVDPLELAQEQLTQLLPEGQVVLVRGIADVRQKQRAAMEGYLALLMPSLLVVCGIWIGVLAMMNVRERRAEIGILRALGHGSGRIAALFLGKSIAVGLAGALLGFFVGTWAALAYGPGIFKVTAKAMAPDYGWLGVALLAAPAFAAVSSFIPTALAVAHDPAETLRSE